MREAKKNSQDIFQNLTKAENYSMIKYLNGDTYEDKRQKRRVQYERRRY